MTTPQETPASKLAAFISFHNPGGCRILSEGDACVCPLCNLSRLTASLARVEADLKEAVELLEAVSHIAGEYYWNEWLFRKDALLSRLREGEE